MQGAETLSAGGPSTALDGKSVSNGTGRRTRNGAEYCFKAVFARPMEESKRRALYSWGGLFCELNEVYSKVPQLLVKNAELHPGMGHYVVFQAFYAGIETSDTSTVRLDRNCWISSADPVGNPSYRMNRPVADTAPSSPTRKEIRAGAAFS